jgi:hypothetical protein
MISTFQVIPEEYTQKVVSFVPHTDPAEHNKGPS